MTHITPAQPSASASSTQTTALLLPATGKREYQQDRYLVLPDFKPKHGGDEQVSCCLVAVFDGHKSEQAAQIAKNTMPQILGERKILCLLVHNKMVMRSHSYSAHHVQAWRSFFVHHWHVILHHQLVMLPSTC